MTIGFLAAHPCTPCLGSRARLLALLTFFRSSVFLGDAGVRVVYRDAEAGGVVQGALCGVRDGRPAAGAIEEDLESLRQPLIQESTDVQLFRKIWSNEN